MDYTSWFKKTFNFDTTCRACKLAHSDQKKYPCIGGSTGATDLSKLKLILISDHPGYYEVKNKYAMYPNIPTDPLGRLNAGAFIRQVIDSWGVDSEREVYYTNAVKCEPGSKTIVDEHLNICYRKWLNKELTKLSQLCPNTPILICGTKAFDIMKKYIKETMLDPKASLNKYRRKVLTYESHPVVATFNPASVCSSITRIETQDVNKVNKIDSVIELPPLPVSPYTIYMKDLESMKNMLCSAIT